jgi:ethanolamine utilization cobalamin adenosyltransferase
MQPLTELDIRLMLKKDETLRSLSVAKGTLITPSAAEYLKTKNIGIVYDGVPNNPVAVPAPKVQEAAGYSSVPAAENASAYAERVFYGPDGGMFNSKPEAMTHLHGNHLVYKDHPVIFWRGKLDCLCASIIEAQVLGVEKGNSQFADELQEILEFIRRLLPCEYKNIPVEEFHLLGLSSEELRERSHNPLKYFGHKHIRFDYLMGPLSVRLNTLRTEVRQVELAAAAAFKDQSGKPGREDIIEALNRLSSLFYIMMYQYLPKDFNSGDAGI